MLQRLILVSVALIVASLTMVAGAGAEATKICVPEKPSKPVLSASAKNECPTKGGTKYKAEELPGQAELEALDQILPHIKYVETGVAGKPTIQFSGVNLQIVNGLGKTESVNGEGNLIIGYDEHLEKFPQTGSHNLVLGLEQSFTSYGGIVAGEFNSIDGPFDSVTGGIGNEASGINTSVSGGDNNVASFVATSISGGAQDIANAEASWVGGGRFNTAAGNFSSVFGGLELTAKREYEAIP
jgi:hypothetical protein